MLLLHAELSDFRNFQTVVEIQAVEVELFLVAVCAPKLHTAVSS